MAKDSFIPLIQQKKTIFPTGGTINLAGMIQLTVSAGALSVPTEICVAAHRRDDGILLHFEPHGVVFEYLAQLTLSQSCWEMPRNNSTLDIYHRSDQSSQWQIDPFITWSEMPKAFRVQIPHFSSYYFIRRQLPSTSQRGVDADGQSQSELEGDTKST